MLLQIYNSILGKPSKKKKDKLGLLAQPRGGRGRKGLGVPGMCIVQRQRHRWGGPIWGRK